MPESGTLRITTCKPFTCLVCNKTFRSTDILNAHKDREHSLSITSPAVVSFSALLNTGSDTNKTEAYLYLLN